jgi:hypothetical protein
LQGKVHIDGFALGHIGSPFGLGGADQSSSEGKASPAPPFSPGNAALQ